MHASHHIFLCGFMGSGKSTQGKKLASLLRMRYIDLDKHIQKLENKTIESIFETLGEKHFRDLETKYLKELVQEKNPKIFSLGGGTVCFNNNIEFIKSSGILIYINMTAAALSERLKKSKQNRPLLKNIHPDEINNFIEQKLKDRQLYYTQAHLTIEGINLTATDLNNAILQFKKHNEKK